MAPVRERDLPGDEQDVLSEAVGLQAPPPTAGASEQFAGVDVNGGAHAIVERLRLGVNQALERRQIVLGLATQPLVTLPRDPLGVGDRGLDPAHRVFVGSGGNEGPEPLVLVVTVSPSGCRESETKCAR